MDYGLDVEVEGILAMYHDPSSGSSFRTYPFPTAGALSQMVACVARMHGVWARPVYVGICRPIEYCEHMCNYHGVYRKQGTDNFQFPSTVIMRPIYKVHFKIERRNGERHPSVDPIHALHEVLTRRISKGGCLHTPFLGRKDFPVSYIGPLRDSTKLCADVYLEVPQCSAIPSGQRSSILFSAHLSKTRSVREALSPMISQLHHALSDLKIDQPIHEWVQKAGKLPTYIVGLNEEGMPVSIRPRTADSSFWRVHKSNHSIFPLLKIQRYESASGALMRCVGFSRELESRLISLKPLIQRIMHIQDANAWFKALEETKRQAIKDGVLRADEQATDAYIVLDLPTAEHRGCAIDSDEMRLVYSRELTDTDPSAHIGVCALTGRETALEKWKYPKPNLPVLGITYLQSMNANIPCQMRYHTISADYYPVSKEALRALNSRLTEITKKDWEGKTWSKVSVDGKKGLLIAHTDIGQDLQLAELFASESAELYARVCEKVVDGLRAHCARGANPEIVKLIVLREIDPGRKGVEFVQQIHSNVLVRNVERISKIIGNAPHFMVAITAQGRIIKNAITPQAVSPVEISLELNQQWLRHGDGRATVHGNHLEEAINLLTSADVQATAHRLLSIMCQRSLPLLAYSKGNIKAKGRALSVLYLLRRLSDGGELMETIGFKLGRYLSVCDWLHKAYCDHVRDGSYPNQLLGNSYFQQFLDRPEKGLASMALRLGPYLAWAKGRGTNEAGGIAGTLGKIATEISEMGLPRKLRDSGRADLLLGYLYQKPKADAADAVQ